MLPITALIRLMPEDNAAQTGTVRKTLSGEGL
jgi:hypothetical protein